MKRIIFLTLIIYLTIFIYNNYSHKDNLILSFGNTINGNYVYKYDNTRITDIINDINYNKKIDNRNIQNILVKASSIYIDLNGIFNCNNYSNIISNFKDLEKLVQLIKKYSKGKIIIKLFTEKNEYTDYTNKKVKIYLESYDIIFMR